MTISDFKKTQQKLLKTIKDFPEENVVKKFYGEWTIKEVVAHIVAWDQYFSNLVKGQTDKYWGDINEFNSREVSKRKSRSLQSLIKDLEASGNIFSQVFDKMDKKMFKRKFWTDKKYTPEDILKIQIHHYEDQIKQILKGI